MQDFESSDKLKAFLYLGDHFQYKHEAHEGCNMGRGLADEHDH